MTSTLVVRRVAECLFVAGLLMAISACKARPATDAGQQDIAAARDAYVNWTLVVESLPAPTKVASRSPQLTARGERAILSWLETANFKSALKFAERTPSGWSDPQSVASGEDVVTNAADVPSVRPVGDRTLGAHWNRQYGDDPEAYSLQLSWSQDGGRTWSQPVTPHHDSTQTQHGFGSLFETAGESRGVVWLDGRAMKPGAPEGSMALWAAAFSADGRQLSETSIDGRACECCQTSVAETAEGVIVAYRDRTAEEVRDISVTRLVDGRWTSPVQVHNDGWTINGCPVNGPSVDARGREVVVAWFTAARGEGEAFLAFSHDAGRSFSAPIRVDDGACRGHLDVELLADGSAAVSWTAAGGGHSQFNVRRIEQNGARSAPVAVANVSGDEYPRLAHGKDELLFTWVEADDGYSHVRTARASLPRLRQ